jgi:hypothetical protein
MLRTRQRTDGQTDKVATICAPFGEHENNLKMILTDLVSELYVQEFVNLSIFQEQLVYFKHQLISNAAFFSI